MDKLVRVPGYAAPYGIPPVPGSGQILSVECEGKILIAVRRNNMGEPVRYEASMDGWKPVAA